LGGAGLRGIFGVDSMPRISEIRDVLMLLRGCFLSLSTFSNFSAAMGVSSTGIGDIGRGLETGSELERMLEKDMTPAARLGVPAAGALDEGAGDSVLASAGRAVDADPLVVALGIVICLRLGDAITGGLVDGLVGPRTGEWWRWGMGLLGR
jgi:hypothetical protein